MYDSEYKFFELMSGFETFVCLSVKFFEYFEVKSGIIQVSNLGACFC